MLQKYYIETFGCTFNEADSRFISQSLDAQSFVKTENPDEADVVIINTCAVRNESELKAIHALEKYSKIAERNGAKILVTGCMVKLNPYKLYNVNRNAIFVTPSLIKEIPKIVSQDKIENRLLIGGSDREYEIIPRYDGKGPYELPIASGCLGSCSFCAVKYTRGTLYSYRPSTLKAAFEEAIKKGAKEIYLTAQDTAVYGLDINTNLIELIEGLIEIEGEYRVRIGMFTPWFAFRISNGLKKIYHNEKVYKFCHVPVQSGDDRILADMQRLHTVKEFKDFIADLRSEHPDIFLATDIIVGYPGEDEEAFENTIKLVKEIEFDKVHVAQYSQRPLTKAASLIQLPDSTKKRRSKELVRICDEITLKKNEKFIGREMKVLVTGKGEKGFLEARAQDYRCVIIKKEDETLIGKFVNVKIEEVTPYYLIARLAS
ncbi:MAG TPA: tRNA (N(6)-L-threonylcarbamoyladenosine(37)-C(2))-methylthiotransferase [Geobacterales bacterium]|nr:tRNA (N(6)-L-threonylcarbamoyladenosine(37)-C(2))-methylthiotransferase [Geobacterales bacterium]